MKAYEVGRRARRLVDRYLGRTPKPVAYAGPAYAAPGRPRPGDLGRLNVAPSVHPPELVDCRECGADLVHHRGAKFCPHCDTTRNLVTNDQRGPSNP